MMRAITAPCWVEYETTVDLYAGMAILEDTPAVFGVTTETVVPEKHPDDPSRRMPEIFAAAELLSLTLGGLCLSRDQVVQMLTEDGRDGEARVRELEADAADEYLQQEIA